MPREFNISFFSLIKDPNFFFTSRDFAFLLQVYSQQNLNPAPVAIIFTLEGVFASIFGWLILDQYLSGIKITGVVFILVAVIFSQLAPIYDKKSHGRN